MKIKMKLLSDAIFGNGVSIPGAEDISILCDEQGFPYYKGGTFKGIFREEMKRFLRLTGKTEEQAQSKVSQLLGNAGSDIDNGKLVFSDFHLSDYVKDKIVQELGENQPYVVTEILTNVRTFTELDEEGIVKKGSLRMARCVNQGISFYSEILCSPEDEALVTEVLQMIKWIGSMRNRGFGKVSFTIVQEVK